VDPVDTFRAEPEVLASTKVVLSEETSFFTSIEGLAELKCGCWIRLY
jgi:hypothetical protein